ncbi:hypothetical protein SUGI_0809150 [Cryptomeria japonica]|nr:hypothetical protein SUGI_0809150 [Cryptomeria japonica]
MQWQDAYARLRAHFLHIPRKGVELCTNEVEHHDVVRDQERPDGKVHNVSSSHASTIGTTAATHNQNRGAIEADVSSRDVTAQDFYKRPHGGSSNPIEIPFDVQGREAVDAIVAHFIYAKGIPFNVAHSPFFGKMVQAINSGPAGYKPHGFKKDSHYFN